METTSPVQDFLPVSDWGLGLSVPVLIAGPCSVETPEQTLQTVQGLAKDPRVQLIRGGIWKPRTRPGSFEGVGDIGLPWLKAAGEAVGKPVATEVANATHVEDALRAGIDVLWIGARTTVNPFSVQEIADALQGVDIPVLVKNPVNPDLALWIGAIERLHAVGIRRLGAIHRGFSFYGKTRYRNQPLWEIPLELRRVLPSLPLICDPSHIGGRRDLLAQIGQTAYDLNFDGLIIESHITPDKAWSDAAQQLTPENYISLIDSLHRRTAGDPELMDQLCNLRSSIDRIDHQLIALLSERMSVSEQIGHFKREHNIAIYQPARWNYVLRDRTEAAMSLGLGDDFTSLLLQGILRESIRHQERVMREEMD